MTITDGTISDARVVLGGVAPIPRRLTEVEDAIRGQSPDEALFARAAAIGLEGAEPLSRNGYKVDLAQALIRRALSEMSGVPVP